jgi:hypothetical protein
MSEGGDHSDGDGDTEVEMIVTNPLALPIPPTTSNISQSPPCDGARQDL